MSKSVTRQIDRISTISPEFGYVASSFDLYLQRVGRADETRSSYMAAVHQLVVFVQDRYKRPTIDLVTRNDVRAFAVSLMAHKEPATVANRVRSLKQFFKWAVVDQLIEVDPMMGFATPRIPEKPIPIISEDDLETLRSLIPELRSNNSTLSQMLMGKSPLFERLGPSIYGLRGSAYDRDKLSMLTREAEIRGHPWIDRAGWDGGNSGDDQMSFRLPTRGQLPSSIGMPEIVAAKLGSTGDGQRTFISIKFGQQDQAVTASYR
ncbi:MAG: phage integrase N-terminal SAM-like domain-containing protein [Chloroflexi bacterium]|nr:phage integrase N-terminal SAM-like domain-containing protein [Chloroflexota bacterium]